ncbi:hypothetical protein ACFL2V_04265 [Pseudomonadota bacterium]
MSGMIKTTLYMLLLVPSISQATLVDFTSNNFSTLTNSATWTDTYGVDFTFSSSHLPFTSKGNEIDRINDRAKDSNGNTIYTDTDSLLTFSFSSYITDLRIYVEDVDQDTDSFENFSILPTSIVGGLTLLTDNTITGLFDGGNQFTDGGNGHLNWTGIYTNSISFDWVRATNMGINIKEVEYSVVAIPEPSPFLLLIPALLYLGYQRKRAK